MRMGRARRVDCRPTPSGSEECDLAKKGWEAGEVTEYKTIQVGYIWPVCISL